jgi:1-deoxy-D-xylulose-5-phosphate synthase
MDENLIAKLVKEKYSIISVEDNMAKGGFGSSIMEYLNRYDYKGKFKILAYDDKFIEQGNVDVLYRENGLDAENIARVALNLI